MQLNMHTLIIYAITRIIKNFPKLLFKQKDLHDIMDYANFCTTINHLHFYFFNEIKYEI